MELRELCACHIEQIKKRIMDIFSGEPWNDVWTEDRLHQYVRELLGNSNALCYGLYEKETLIGISLGRIKHWCEGAEYWIDEFGIVPEKQGQGAGTAFLGKIAGCLAEKGVTGMVLLTERTAPAYSFYKRNGFQEHEGMAFLAAKPS